MSLRDCGLALSAAVACSRAEWRSPRDEGGVTSVAPGRQVNNMGIPWRGRRGKRGKWHAFPSSPGMDGHKGRAAHRPSCRHGDGLGTCPWPEICQMFG